MFEVSLLCSYTYISMWLANVCMIILLVFCLQEIFSATSVVRPRADVAYCIHALAKRLSKTRNWIVIFFFHYFCFYCALFPIIALCVS